MSSLEPISYYNEECYGKRQCLHCGDCLAWAKRFLQEGWEEEERKRAMVRKFLTSTICRENFPCPYALSLTELNNYLNNFIGGEAELPLSHYEFVKDLK
jgi:hypothetical protein